MNDTGFRSATLRRGRVLIATRGHTLDGGSISSGRKGDWIRKLAAVCSLPLFTQCFQYMTDIPPLYMMSKVWPFLMLPVAIWALVALDMPHKVLHLAALFWFLAVTPVIGILQLGSDFSGAMATTVKVWSFTYIYAVAGFLALLRCPPDLLRRAIPWLGVGTFVVMALLWVTVPTRAYGGGDLDTKLFMTDVERGYRIYMPMFFGVMLIFYLNRSAWIRFAWWKPVGIVVSLVLMLMIYKQRAAIASVLLALVIGAVLSMRRWRGAGFSVLVLGAYVGLIGMMLRAQSANELKSNLGNSLAVRQVSVSTAWNYLSTEPMRWILGVGGTTRLGNVTLGALFHNPMFFLADIGWLGVWFEYGAIGVILMLLIYVTGLRSALRWAKSDDALSQAFADYIIYLLAASTVYSAVFTPGELATTIALSYYLANPGRRSKHVPAYQPGHDSANHNVQVESWRPVGHVKQI